MNRFKVFIYVLLLIVFIGIIGIAGFAIVKAVQYKNNDVEFIVENKQAFCEINGIYTGPEPENSGNNSTTYSDAYRETDLYKSSTKTLSAWNVGATTFILNEAEEMTFTITIKNLNKNYDLNVTLANVAYDAESKFITSIQYQLSNEVSSTIPSMSPNGSVVNVAPKLIPVNETLTMVIKFNLNTRSKSITAKNNFSIKLASIIPNE